MVHYDATTPKREKTAEFFSFYIYISTTSAGLLTRAESYASANVPSWANVAHKHMKIKM